MKASTFLLFLAGCAPRCGMELQVAASQPMKTGEALYLRCTLANHGRIGVTVSPRWEGNVRVVSFTRDGIGITPQASEVIYEIEPFSVLQETRIPLAGGASEEFRWVSEAGVGGQVLRLVHLDPATPPHHQALFYPVEMPGAYKLSVAYRYPGTDAFNEELAAATDLVVSP